jgi:hypothetical protein
MRGCAAHRVSSVLIYTAVAHFRGRYVRVEATSMAEADMQSAPWARLLVARDWAIGVNTQSAK